MRGPMTVRRLSGYASLAIFVALLLAGIFLDEFRSVLVNAANVCLSCIGIG